VDEIVLRSIAKWPNVPAVFGWLRLDRRGDWLVRMPALPGSAEGTERFDRIRNAAVVEFIGRNYAADDAGRWYFQNGPQRVFVTLDCSPWVYRLDDAGAALVAQNGAAAGALVTHTGAAAGALVTHTGAPAGAPRAAFIDEQGALILECAPGIGVVLDRDLAAVAECFAGAAGAPLDLEALFQRVRSGEVAHARLMGAALEVSAVRSDALPARFRYVARPVPAPGQAEC